MNNISVIIVAKDDPRYLLESIRSIDDLAGEIIIVDIGLNLNIKEKLSNNSKVHIISFKNAVSHVEQIRESVKSFAKNEYIFFLDPDEIVSDGLKKKIVDHYLQFDYLQIPRKNIIFGKWIQHSRWWPDYQIRFFKKNNLIWPKQIHQQPHPKGRGYIIEIDQHFALIHYNYQNIDEFLMKAARYAKVEASELHRKQTSYTIALAIQRGISEYMSRFFAAEGYKDGIHGLSLALLQMFYSFLVYFYYWEQKHFPEEKDPNGIWITWSFFYQGLEESNYWLQKKKKQNFVVKLKLKLQNIFMNLLRP